MEKVKYHEMLPHEIVARRRRFPAAFVPSGVIELHGAHMAVGNDALKAEKLCELAAAKSGGFLFPTMWYGEPRTTGLIETIPDDDGWTALKMKLMRLKKRKFTDKHFGSTAGQQIELFRQLIRHTLIQMNQLEMKAVIILFGHWSMRTWALPVVEQFNNDFGDTLALAAIENDFAPDNPKVGGDHAGKWETSYLWYLRPDCVDTSICRGCKRGDLVGVICDDPPQEAPVELGRTACNLMADGMVRAAKRLLEKARQ